MPTVMQMFGNLKRESREDGFSMIELVAAMVILGILITITLSATMSMFRSAVRSQAIVDARDQIRVTFHQLDKEIRYASAINAPGFVNGAHYVEYLVDYTVADGATECVQWRLNPTEGVMERRSWALGTSAPSSWQVRVDGIRNDFTDPAQTPFTLLRAGTNSGKENAHQQLSVFIDKGIGEAGAVEGGQLRSTFVALNSNATSPNMVCLDTGVSRS